MTVLLNPGHQARTDDPLFERVLEAIDSGGELVEIYKYLKDHDSREFFQKLKHFVKGVYFQKSESGENNSNRARNYGFELFMASQIAKAQFHVRFPKNTDIETLSPVIRFECKRPQSQKKLSSALKKARDQLQNAANEEDPIINVIAVSIGKLIHQGSAFLYYPNLENGEKAIRQLVENNIEKCRPIWRDPSFSQISGLWFQYSGIAVFNNPQAIAKATYNKVVVRPDPEKREREAALRILGSSLETKLGFHVI